MHLNMGLDLLHRRIEEWAEEAMIEPDVPEREVEAFREYGSELVAFLHDVSEEMELGFEDLMVPGDDATAGELCEELTQTFLDEWERLSFGERPGGLEMDALREVLEAVTEVVEAPVDDADLELEDAAELLDEFLADTW